VCPSCALQPNTVVSGSNSTVCVWLGALTGPNTSTCSPKQHHDDHVPKVVDTVANLPPKVAVAECVACDSDCDCDCWQVVPVTTAIGTARFVRRCSLGGSWCGAGCAASAQNPI
jgi:hypothetical protein